MSSEQDYQILIDYISDKMDKEFREQEIRQDLNPMYLALEQGFVETREEYEKASSKSLLENGGFETATHLSTSPSGWAMSGCVGVVLPYSAQCTDVQSLYVSSSGSNGVPSSSAANVFDSVLGPAALIQAYVYY